MSPTLSWLLLCLLALDAIFLAIVIGGTRKPAPRTGPRPVGGSSGLRRGLGTTSPTASESDRNLETHHRTYERRGEEMLSDLTLLCSACHTAVHLVMDARAGKERKTSRRAEF